MCACIHVRERVHVCVKRAYVISKSGEMLVRDKGGCRVWIT